MQIAIIGAGLSGLALAYYLSLHRDKKVTLFDEKGIGLGTSGIAAGLLHPFAGAHAKLNWRGFDGWNATCELIEVSSQALGSPVAAFSGVLRLADDDEQKRDYALCSQKYQNVHWWEASKVQATIPIVAEMPGIFIEQGTIIDSPKYLQGLWQACQKNGVLFQRKKIETLKEVDQFDQIIVAAGSSSNKFAETSSLPISSVKGQVLQMEWPENILQPQVPINSYAYFAMNADGKSCIAGATYEREEISEIPNVEIASREILPKLSSFLPIASQFKILDCKAGIRASTPDHKPIAKQIRDKVWVLTGMGSKGLLYHALFAKELVGCLRR